MMLDDIYLIHLSQIEGHEQIGKCPAIILQEGKYNLLTVLIVPLTIR